LKTDDFDYHLPEELIAQTPMEPRDHSRLMVLDRASGAIEHRRFYDLPGYLRPGDVLVFNDSRVIPARLHARRTGGGGSVELLLLRREGPGRWHSLVKPGRRMRQGDAFEVSRDGRRIAGEVVAVHEDGSRTVELSGEEHLDALGVVPLPPYIHEPLADPERYQTVYARAQGSVAAPTAGLHFTQGLLDQIRSRGVETVFVTLHVGLGTFRPVTVDDPESHKMHPEYWELTSDAAEAIGKAKTQGRRVISVGTTAVRLMEQAASQVPDGQLSRGSGWADIFIYPGHRFRLVDALVTNFHLPKSTLLMLTSALAGRERLLAAYQEAASLGYRFYSFGDAMLVV
jgi:S-adenosylmethionine:tRNA ribosyltransferase-isomerase